MSRNDTPSGDAALRLPRKRIVAIGLLAFVVAMVAPALAVGQSAPATQVPAQGDELAEDYKPTNLTVLPQDISRRELRKRMRQYKEQLGVDCGYCHDKDRETGEINYVSDHNPVKDKARTMIAMTGEINEKFLSRLGDRRYAEPFECAGCHRGQAKPVGSE